MEQNKADETKNVENESYNLHNNTVSLSTEQFSMWNSLNLTEFISFHIMLTLQQINKKKNGNYVEKDK